MKIKRFTDTTKNKITALLVDNYYLWKAYLGADNACKLDKVSVFDPSSIYFNLDITATKIIKISNLGSYIYTLFDDSDYLFARISKSNPIGSKTYITIPTGIIETPVDMDVDATNNYVYILFPGNESGTCSKILQYNNSLSLVSTIDLDQSVGDVNNAKSIAVDSNGYLWVVTYEDPSRLIKVNPSDGSYNIWYITDESGYN